MAPKIIRSMADAQARGKRLKTLRMMTDLTRKMFEEKYDISASTLQSWEVAKAGGLTARGVKRLLPIFHQAGIACTEHWLLYGIGSPPRVMDNTSFSDVMVETILGSAALIQELRYVRQLHPNWVDFIIEDDGTAPHYQRDDVVAGRRCHGEGILTVIGSDCIVQTIQNVMFFRRVMRGAQPGRYNLVCTNITTTSVAPILYDQQLLSAAPVLWHRRRDLP